MMVSHPSMTSSFKGICCLQQSSQEGIIALVLQIEQLRFRGVNSPNASKLVSDEGRKLN